MTIKLDKLLFNDSHITWCLSLIVTIYKFALLYRQAQLCLLMFAYRKK